jgi:hypothetical protein
VLVNTQLLLLLLPLSLPLLPPLALLLLRQALVAALQALNFEATLCESRDEAIIVAPPKGSEHATKAALEAASNTVDLGFV